MNTFDRVKQLANSHGIPISRLEEDLGFGRNSLYSWKTKAPNGDRLKKVADYFNVSTDYLLGRKANDKEVDLADKDAFLMYQGKPVSDEDKEMILRLMRGKEED